MFNSVLDLADKKIKQFENANTYFVYVEGVIEVKAMNKKDAKDFVKERIDISGVKVLGKKQDILPF